MDFHLIGQQIRTLRKERGLPQEELAERADLSVPYLSHVERAVKKVSLESLVRIAEALGVTADRLLTGNQPSDRSAFLPEVQELMQDCTLWERRIICDVAGAVKRSLRMNHGPV